MALNVDGATMAELQGNPELSQENLDAVNQMLEQSLGMDLNGGLEILGYLGLGINILYLAIFIASAIGLYKLSKKLGDTHSWLAFIPLIQLYTYFKTAGYGFIKGFIFLILFTILGVFLSGIAMMGMTPIIASIFGSGDMTSMLIGSLLLTVVITVIIVLIATFFLYAGMARRAGQSGGTAILMALFPWCMMWIVANRLPPHSEQITAPSSGKIEQTPVSNIEL